MHWIQVRNKGESMYKSNPAVSLCVFSLYVCMPGTNDDIAAGQEPG